MKKLFLLLIVGLNLFHWALPVRAITEPTPENAPWEALAGTQAGVIKRATAAGSLTLDTPEERLMAIAALPATKIACTQPTWWWLALVFQFTATIGYVVIFKPKVLSNGWLWLTGISVVAYMVYAMIGCSCTGNKICHYYLLINLSILVLFAGGLTWKLKDQLPQRSKKK